MSQICLYLDEDTIQKGLVQALRNAAVDVTTTSYLVYLIAQKNKICGFRPPNPSILGGKEFKVPQNWGI